MDGYRAQDVFIWRRKHDGHEGICVDTDHADVLDASEKFEVVKYAPADELRGAVDLLRELSEKWTDVRVSGNAARITALGDAIKRAREFVGAGGGI